MSSLAMVNGNPASEIIANIISRARNAKKAFETGATQERYDMAERILHHQGAWHSVDENLNYTHFMNTTKVVRPIPANEPDLAEIHVPYWNNAGI